MEHRKLRIAWSVAWSVAAMLLCALWVRSYWTVASIQVPNVLDRNHQLILSTGTIHYNSIMPQPRYGSMSLGIVSYHWPGRDVEIYSNRAKARTVQHQI